MSTPSVRALGAPLAFALLLAVAPAALAAGSVTVQGEGVSAGSVTTLAPPAARSRAADPKACAAALHGRLREIREGPYAALRALGTPPAAASPGPTGTASAMGLVFPPPGRPRGEDETRALRAAASLARLGPAAGATPLDADGRWVAARLREDLGDYLGQKPTDFLCAGTGPYLATLRRQAERLGTSPARSERDLLVQREAARRALTSATRALEPVPVPMAAPARTEATPLASASEDLRRSVGLGEAEAMGPPAPSTLVAAARSGETRISEGGFDPDLPPVANRPEWRLESESDILAAIDGLAAQADKAGLFAPAIAQGTDAITTGAVAPAPGTGDGAVRMRLVALRPLVDGSSALRTDMLLRGDILEALSSLEALDLLRAAATRPADPLPAAFEATFRAIEDAREASGRSAP